MSWRVGRYSSSETGNCEYLRLVIQQRNESSASLTQTDYIVSAPLTDFSKTVHCINTYIKVGFVFSSFPEHNSDINFNLD